jgi:hypothetical protein
VVGHIYKGIFRDLFGENSRKWLSCTPQWDTVQILGTSRISTDYERINTENDGDWYGNSKNAGYVFGVPKYESARANKHRKTLGFGRFDRAMDDRI